jgi:hypothetical protein
MPSIRNYPINGKTGGGLAGEMMILTTQDLQRSQSAKSVYTNLVNVPDVKSVSLRKTLFV